jgi:hypothetical protein
MSSAEPRAETVEAACDREARSAVEKLGRITQFLESSGPWCTGEESTFLPTGLSYVPSPKPRLAPSPPAPKPGASSFRTLILQGHPGLRRTLGEACFDAMRKIYLSRRTLRSEKLRKASHPLTYEKFKSGVRDFHFFHYAKAQAMLDQFHPEVKDRRMAHALALQEGAYEKMMLFFRTRDPSSATTLPLYVAEDPYSSSHYGPLRVRISFAPATRGRARRGGRPFSWPQQGLPAMA